MKILTKIKRRADGDELPTRGHLVEMELYDTDRNPLELSQGGDGRTEYIDLSPSVAVPFDPVVGPPVWGAQIAEIDFELTNQCYLVVYGGAIFDVSSGAGADKSVSLDAQIEPMGGGGSGGANFHTEGTFTANDTGYTTSGFEAFSPGVFNPGSYQFVMWCYRSDDTFEATVRKLGVSAVLFPTNGGAGLSVG